MIQLDNGLSTCDLAESAFNVFRNSLGHNDVWGNPVAEWTNVDYDTQDAWIDATRQAVDRIRDADGASWALLARFAYEQYAETMGYKALAFESQYPETRAAWIAVVKHLANLLALEEVEDLKQHEDYWLNYSENALAKDVG